MKSVPFRRMDPGAKVFVIMSTIFISMVLIIAVGGLLWIALTVWRAALALV